MARAPGDLESIVRKFRGLTIGIFGDLMLDELFRGEATRISPEAPVPVVLSRPASQAMLSPAAAATSPPMSRRSAGKRSCSGPLGLTRPGAG